MTMQRGTLNGGSTGVQGGNGDVAAGNLAPTDLINILDALEVPVVVLRRDLAISWFNKAGAGMLGLSPSDIGRASRDISVFDALPHLEQQCGEVIAGGGESRANFRDGEKWFVVRISPYTKVECHVDGIVLTFTNITAFRASTDQAIYERECTKAILNTVADPLVVLSADLRIQTGNCAFYTMFGVSRDDTQGVPLYQLGHGVFELAPLREHLKEMLAVSPAFQPVEVDHVFTVKGQRTFVLDAYPLSFPGHSERRVLVTFQDITAIKQAETVLRELNDTLEKQVRIRTEELSLIIETIPGLVWCAAPAGELNYLNRRILDYTGTTPEAFAELGWTSFLHPDDVEPTVSAWSRAVATGEPYDTQCRLRRSDGIYRWFQVLGEAARDNNGSVTRWYGLLIDIDDRKNMEEALRVNERDLRLIVDTIPALVCTMTSRGKLETVNQQAIDYCGYAPTDSSAIHPDDIERVDARWRHSVETGEPHDVDLRLRRFDGVYRWFHVRGLPLRDAERHILRWYVLLTDIEGRRRAEEALRSSETRLSRATRTATLGEFAASLAHEINQPLAAVVANGHACLRWLSAQPTGLAKAQEAAERIVRDGTEAGEVVRRIRALFKHAPLDKVDLDLNEVVAEVLRLLSGERTRRHVSVETDLEKDLGPVAGDRVQLQQVVFNLLLNGIEAMDSVVDRPKELLIRSKRPSPETVLVEIRDSGVGIKDTEKVFEAFFTTKENGMGMGLAVCRSIIDAHHGRLWAASGEGTGTTFSFTLPTAEVRTGTVQAAS
jgi:PAS domain S-box-containing protein